MKVSIIGGGPGGLYFALLGSPRALVLDEVAEERIEAGGNGAVGVALCALELEHLPEAVFGGCLRRGGSSAMGAI